MISNVNIVFKIAAQKYTHKAFFLPNLRSFILAQTFLKNSKVPISNIAIVSQTYIPKNTQLRYFGSKFDFFSFAQIFFILKSSRVLISNVIIVISHNDSNQSQIQKFFCPKVCILIKKLVPYLKFSCFARHFPFLINRGCWFQIWQ